MKDSLKPYAVVDLFAGPGGLGEGFAGCRQPRSDAPCFRTVLSVENDRHAHRTLLSRAFLRKFEDGFPEEYYRFVNGQSPEPDWAALAPDKWRQASDETRRLELGTPQASAFLEERIRQIRRDWGDRTVLIGGPPCQAYSVAGRVRRAAVPNYDPRKDGRYRLYRQYIDVLAKLRPAVAVMENVKGLLSATLEGDRIVELVLVGLRYPRNDTTYRTYALCPRASNGSLLDGGEDGEDTAPADFVLRAEEHGVPQKRHRVFVVCVREDIADTLPDGAVGEGNGRASSRRTGPRTNAKRQAVAVATRDPAQAPVGRVPAGSSAFSGVSASPRRAAWRRPPWSRTCDGSHHSLFGMVLATRPLMRWMTFMKRCRQTEDCRVG